MPSPPQFRRSQWGRRARPQPRTITAPPFAAITLVLGALAAASACAGQPAQRPRAKETPQAPTEPAAAAFTSPARWSYHPAPPETADAWLRLPEGGCVLTTNGGQRWTISPIKGLAEGSANSARPCAGRAQAASSLAPEELTGIVRRPGMSWIFIGASGTLYETATPLATFTRTTPPPEPLAKVAGAGSTLLGTTLEGKLLRWSDSGGWQDAPIPGQTAAASLTRVFDVAVAEGGRALTLALPEALSA